MASLRSYKERRGNWPGKIVSPRNKWKDPEGGYKEFIIGDLFTIVKGKRLTKAHMLPGDINFIGATSTNNGLTAKIGNTGHLHPAGTITVTYNGSVGEAFYQTEQFWASDDVNVLYPKFPMNDNVALYFLAPLIKKGKSYGYSYKWTKEKMKKDSIVLPVNIRGEVDCGFIEERVRELKEERVRELKAYLSAAGFDDCTITRREEETIQLLKENAVSHKLFRIGELFDISTGRDIIIGRTKEGNVPLISHQHDDNGISKRIERMENRRLFDFNTTLSLADRGVFLATTQAENFHIGTRVKALTFKTGCQTENVRLFFVTSINKLQTFFVDYLTNATDNLPNLQISLPVDSNGNIDYGFIDTYVSAIKKEYISRIKQEIEREYKKYGQVIGNQTGKAKAIELNKTNSYYTEAYFEPLMAAEPFECYKWEGFDQSICDFFGGDKTILIGCYKGKKYKDWIHNHNIYTIRLGGAKGSMEANRELFDSTSLLILYELGKPNKLSAYKIVGNKEMGKDELLAMDYPNKKPRKSYMTFSITPLEMDLTFLIEHHLIERLIELNSDNAKGTPVFIQP